MGRISCLVALLGVAAAGWAPASGQVGESVLDGVFTLSQAARGELTLRQACLSCHAVTEHTGRRFSAKWSNSTLGDLFEIVSETMPEGDPGSLKAEEYASILAFYLKESGYPDGQQDLPSEAAALMKVRIEPLSK